MSDSFKLKVYLCGGIFGLSTRDCTDWRERAKELLGDDVRTVDPMRRDYRGREDDCAKEIVEGDKTDIEGCDVLLCYAKKPSWGTAMEVLHAYKFGKKIVVVGMRKISPWLRYHATAVCPTIEHACLAVTARNI